MDELERKFEELRRFNATLGAYSDKNVEYDITIDKLRLKKDVIELIVNEMYDKMTKLFNERRGRLGIKGGDNIEEPIRNYHSFDLYDNGKLTFVHKNEVIGLGNINEGHLQK